MYEQSLVKILKDHIKPSIIKKNNRYKKWEYGYDVEHDVVVISKTGEIGEIYEIQNLKIALPKQKNIHKFEDKKWSRFEYPKQLQKIKTVFDWEQYPNNFKESWYDYIDNEFTRREEGFWFYNKDNPTYITGSHYMYLQWSKIDVGAPNFRESNRLFFIFWEACKADPRSYGMCYLKNRRSGFSFMASGEVVNLATISSDSRYGILSKSGPDAKTMFTDKVVPISSNRSRTVWTVQRPSLPTVSQQVSSQGGNSLPTKPLRIYKDLTQRSIGRTPVIIPTTVRNSSSSFMMNRASGKGRTTSSTTGGLRRPR
jgi:hypothetical protein